MPGKFKDEARGQQIEEVLALCPESYSIKMYEEGKENKKCKGITKTVTKNVTSHEDYKNTLFTGKEHMRTMKIIRSDRHEVYSVEVNEVALSSKDDKRHVLPSKTDTLALGHCSLKS